MIQLKIILHKSYSFSKLAIQIYLVPQDHSKVDEEKFSQLMRKFCVLTVTTFNNIIKTPFQLKGIHLY